MTELIRTYLEQIYPAEAVEDTYKAILNRIGETPTAPHSKLFSEQDITLITYGDSLKRNDEAPLKTLNEFENEYLKDIISHIHILPFYPYSSDDGFSVIDFYAVDPDLGTWDNITRLGENFKLMFDAVFNHMSAKSEWFANFLADKPDFKNMFITYPPDTDLSTVTRPRTSPLLTPFTKSNGETVHVWTTFSDDQVDINFADPETLLRMLDVLLFYVDQGATIIRLDAIAYMWKIVGTSSIHLEQTHTVIKLMHAVLDLVAPKTILITETNVPHAENVSYFGDGTDEAQMVYNFTLPPLLFHTLLSGNSNKLRHWINSLTTPSNDTTFFNFTASHDGIGVRPVEGILDTDEIAAMVTHVEATGGRVSYKANSDGSQSPYELNVTYVDAVTDATEPIDMQTKRFLVSQSIAMCLAGMPAIYIHSLLGSRNDIKGMEKRGINRAINRAKLDADLLQTDLHDSNNFRAHVFQPYLHLIKTRKKFKHFHPNAKQEAIDTGNEAVVTILRTAADGSQIHALHNITNQHQTIKTTWQNTTIDVLTGESVNVPDVTLAPYEIRWLK